MIQMRKIILTEMGEMSLMPPERRARTMGMAAVYVRMYE
jgi:hypothetical protein